VFFWQFTDLSYPSLHQDTLFVLRIGKGGVADRNGLLRRGDEIVEINGQNMKEVNTVINPLFQRSPDTELTYSRSQTY